MRSEDPPNDQIEALIQEGNQCLMMGENWKARSFYLQCEDIFSSHKRDIRPELLTQVYYNIGLSYSNMYISDKAISYYNKCIGYCDESTQPLVYANIGEVHEREEKISEALEYFKQSLKLYKSKFPNSQERTRLECKAGDSYYKLGLYQDAIEHYKNYLQLKESLKLAHLSSIETFYNLGLAYQTLNEMQKSTECFEKSLELSRKSEQVDKDQQITLLYQLAQVYQRQSLYSKAIKSLSQVLKLQDTDCQKSETYLRLGTIFHIMQKNKEASRYFEKFLASVLQENTAEFLTKVSVVLNNMGNIEYKNGNSSKALARYTKCLQIEQKLFGKRSIEVASTKQNIGNCHFLEKEFSEAIDCYKDSFEIKSKLGCEDIEETLKLLGDAHYFKESLHPSLHYYQRYLQSCQKKDKVINEDIISVLTNVGNLHYRMNNTTQALQAYKLAQFQLQGNQDTLLLAPILCNIGNIYYENQKYELALEEYNKSLAIYQEHNLDITPNLVNLGNAYEKMEEITKALEYWLKALQLQKKDEDADPTERIQNLRRIGEAYKKIGDRKKALEYLKEHVKECKLSESYSYKEYREIYNQIKELQSNGEIKYKKSQAPKKVYEKISRSELRNPLQMKRKLLLSIL